MSSGSIRVKELDKLVREPAPPAHYSSPAKAAWRKGCMRRAWAPQRLTNPYSKPYMQTAWIEGFRAMDREIAAARPSPPESV